MNFLVNPMFGDDLGRTGKGIKEGVGPPKPLRESSEHTQSCPPKVGQEPRVFVHKLWVDLAMLKPQNPLSTCVWAIDGPCDQRTPLGRDAGSQGTLGPAKGVQTRC